MNTLSLFDGMSCGQIALNQCGIRCDNYFASEVDPHTVKVTMANYPGTKQVGDVEKIDYWGLPKIDLLFGGSPCQGFSLMGKGLDFDDPRSRLFFAYLETLEILQPQYFLLENVRMKKEIQDQISKLLGVEPVLINSKYFVPQSRPRLYWTNLPVGAIPTEEKKLQDILEDWTETKYLIGEGQRRRLDTSKDLEKAFSKIDPEIAVCMTARQYANWKGTFVNDWQGLRRLTPVECERLQGVPDNYTNHVADCHRYKMLGNGWTVPVISHIFEGLKTEGF